MLLKNKLLVDFTVSTLKVFPTLSLSVRNWPKMGTKEDMITWRKSHIGSCVKNMKWRVRINGISMYHFVVWRIINEIAVGHQ